MKLPNFPVLLAHRGPCPGSWSIVTDEPPFADCRTRSVVALCWTCGIRWDFTAATTATDDPERDDNDRVIPVPDEHRPYIGTSYAGTGAHELPAAVLPRTVAGLQVHVESGLSSRPDDDRFEGAFLFLVATKDGDVIGKIGKHRGPRGGDRFHVAAIDAQVWRAEDVVPTIAAAVKLLKAAVL